MIHVTTAREGERLRHVPGPADLGVVGAGALIDVRGEPGERDYARWGAAIGAAVLRGASVRRLP